ncbi:MAG: tetratricopeptide repeat protein [Chrysiogenetes bacterium]|nr:tetratricopeptide repeat protein [Chrysiogenetes bacterium]
MADDNNQGDEWGFGEFSEPVSAESNTGTKKDDALADSAPLDSDTAAQAARLPHAQSNWATDVEPPAPPAEEPPAKDPNDVTQWSPDDFSASEETAAPAEDSGESWDVDEFSAEPGIAEVDLGAAATPLEPGMAPETHTHGSDEWSVKSFDSSSAPPDQTLVSEPASEPAPEAAPSDEFADFAEPAPSWGEGGEDEFAATAESLGGTDIEMEPAPPPPLSESQLSSQSLKSVPEPPAPQEDPNQVTMLAGFGDAMTPLAEQPSEPAADDGADEFSDFSEFSEFSEPADAVPGMDAPPPAEEPVELGGTPEAPAPESEPADDFSAFSEEPVEPLGEVPEEAADLEMVALDDDVELQPPEGVELEPPAEAELLPPAEEPAEAAEDSWGGDFSEFSEPAAELVPPEPDAPVAMDAEASSDIAAEEESNWGDEFSEPVAEPEPVAMEAEEPAEEDNWGDEFSEPLAEIEPEAVEPSPPAEEAPVAMEAAELLGEADEADDWGDVAEDAVSLEGGDEAAATPLEKAPAESEAADEDEWEDEFAEAQPEEPQDFEAEPLEEAPVQLEAMATMTESGVQDMPLMQTQMPVEEADEDDWGDVADEAAPAEEVASEQPAPAAPGVSISSDDLPLSIGSYAAHLDSRAQADADAAVRAAAEREAREADRPSFQRTGDAGVDAQLEILYRELQDREDEAERALFQRRIAEVYAAKAMEVKLKAGARFRALAKDNLIAARKSAGESLSITRQLRRILEQEEQWPEVLSEAEHEEQLAGRAGDQTGRLEALFALARAQERLEQDEQVVQVYQKILTIDARSLAALQGLDAALTRRHEWEALIDVLEREIGLVEANEEQAQIYYRLGQILSHFLAEQKESEAGGVAAQVFTNKVIGCFQSAAEKAANPVPALSALRQIYQRFAKWPEFIEVSGRLVERVEQPAAKVYLLYHAGRTLLERMSDPNSALEYYQRILEIDPANLLTLKAIETIALDTNNTQALLDSLVRQEKAVEDNSQKALLSLRVGKLYDEIFGETDQAIEWFSRALEHEPRNQYVLQSLGKLHARNRSWEKLEQIFEFEAEAAGDVKQKLDFMLKRAELLSDRLDNVPLATEVLYTALEVDDTNLAVYRQLGRLLAQQKRWPELIRLYEAELTLTHDKERQVAIYMSLGGLWQEDFDPEENVDKDAKAVEAYYHALEVDPDHTPALRTLGKLFAVRQDWQSLSEVFSKEAQLAGSDDTRVAIFIRMAELEEDRNKDWERAVFYLRKALELDPHNKMVLSGLARLTPKLEQWDDLLQAYIRDSETSQDARYMAAMHQRIGELWQEQFHFPRKADDSFRKAAQLQSGNIVALRSLEENYENEGDWENLCNTLLEDLQETSEPDQKVIILKRLAEVTGTRREDSRKAAYYYDEILKIAPENFDALEQVARLAGEMGEWERQASALSGLLKVAQDPAYLNRIRTQFGRLLVTRHPIEDANEQARIALEAVLDRHPEDGEVLDLLATLYHEAGLWDELAGVLRRRIELDTEDAARAAHYRWLGRALIEGSAPGEQAIEALGKALAIDGADLSTRVEMARACEKAERYDEAAAQYAALREEMHDIERQRALGVELARVQYEKLNQHGDAISVLREILKEEIDHAGALSFLKRIAEEQQNWDEAINLVENRYALCADDKARVPILLELADLWDERKQDLDKAAEACSKALAIAPDNLEAIRHLGEIELRRDNAKAYCILGEKEIEILSFGEEGLLKYGERLHELHHRLAKGYRDSLKDSAQAREHLRAALNIKSEDFDAMSALEQLYELDRMWEELADAYSYRAEKTEDHAEKLRLFLEAGRTWRDRSQATQAQRQAIGEYVKALDVSPNDAVVLEELAELYQRVEEYDRAATTIERLVEVVDAPAKPELLARAGRIRETRLGEIDEAVARYQSALELKNDCIPAAEPLAEIYYQKKDWRHGLPLYELLARRAFDSYVPDEQARFLFQHGVVLENLGQDEQAIGNYRAAIDRKAHYLAPIDALTGTYERLRQWDNFAATLDTKASALEALGKQDELFGVYARLGEAYEQLKKPDQALTRYKQAVENNGDFANGFEAIGRICHRQGNFEGAAAALRQAAEAAERTRQMQQASNDWFVCGGLLLKELGRPADAVKAFENSLAAHSGHPHALDRLARARYQAGLYDEAREAFVQLVNGGAEGSALADYENHLGRISLEGHQDPQSAIAHFENALAADERHRETYESLGELYEQAQQWDKAAATYEKFIQLVQGEDPRAAAPLHVKLGDLYKDKLSQPERAMVELRKAVRLDPSDTHPHIQLAQIFESNSGTYGEAVKEHAALLAIDPFRYESYHALFKMYESQGAHDKAFCVAGALVLMGQASDTESLFYEAQASRNPPHPKAAFESPHQAAKMLWHPGCNHGVAEYFLILGHSMGRLSPYGLDNFGVGRGDRLAPEDTGAPNQMVRRALELAGNPECDVYSCRQKNRELRVLPTPKHASILVGSDFFAGIQDVPPRAFMTGRALWPLIDGSYGVSIFQEDKQLHAVQLAGHLLDETVRVSGDPNEVKKDAKLIGKELSRKDRKDAEALVGKYKNALGGLDMDAWRTGMDRTADRFGLLLCNNLKVAAGQVAARDPKFQGSSLQSVGNWAQAFAENEAVQELLRYAVSEEYFGLRQRLKLSILAV